MKNTPKNASLYFPFDTHTTIHTRWSAKAPSVTLSATLSSCDRSNGVNPTNTKPIEATARLTISTEMRPSSAQ